MTVLIAHDNQGTEGEAATTLNDLGYAVNENHFFLQVERCMVNSGHESTSLSS